MFDDSMMAVLQGPHPLIVATTSPDGEPHAARAWGITDIDPDEGRFRLLLDATDTVAVSHASDGAAIAITSGDVRTLRSVQLKGSCTGVEPATPEDRDASRRLVEQFSLDVEETDGTPRHLLLRLVPSDLVATVVVVTELFNQTPGPKAGEALGGKP